MKTRFDGQTEVADGLTLAVNLGFSGLFLIEILGNLKDMVRFGGIQAHFNLSFQRPTFRTDFDCQVSSNSTTMKPLPVQYGISTTMILVDDR